MRKDTGRFQKLTGETAGSRRVSEVVGDSSDKPVEHVGHYSAA